MTLKTLKKKDNHFIINVAKTTGMERPVHMDQT